TLDKVMYTIDFIGLVFGASLADSPNSGWKKLSNKSNSFKTIGALVGKRTNSAGVVIDKFFMIEAKANSYGQTFPTEDLYTESLWCGCAYNQRARKAV